MQVEKAQIEAGFPRAGDAEQAVGIRLVVGAEAAVFVHIGGKRLHLPIIDAGVLRICHNIGGGALGNSCFQRLHAGQAGLRVRLEIDHLEPVHHRGGRIGRMRIQGGDDLVALFPAALKIGPDDRSHRKNPLRAAARLEGEPVHPGNLAHIPVGLIVDFEHPLYGRRVLKRVQLLHAAGELLVDLGAVFHRAGTLPDLDVDIRAEYLLGQAQIVAEHPVLGNLGQVDPVFAFHACGQRANPLDLRGDLFARLRHKDAALAGGTQLIDHRLIPLGLMEVLSDLCGPINSVHNTHPFLDLSGRLRDRRHQPFDVVLCVDFGHAVEGRLSKLREFI